VSEEMLPESRAMSTTDSLKTFAKADASIEPLPTNPIPAKNTGPEKVIAPVVGKTSTVQKTKVSIPEKPKRVEQTHQRPKAVMKRKV
jgi:cell division protein FtsQ